MMFPWTRHAEQRGILAGIEAAEARVTRTGEEYERIIAILREQLGQKEKERVEAVKRADVAADRVFQLYGAHSVSTASTESDRARIDGLNKVAAAVNQDIFAELPPNDPKGSYIGPAEVGINGPDLGAGNGGIVSPSVREADDHAP